MFLDGLEDAYDNNRLMGSLAEDCASRYQFSREAQDEFALQSLANARLAQDEGAFEGEIAPVTISTRRGDVTVEADEAPARHAPKRFRSSNLLSQKMAP